MDKERFGDLDTFRKFHDVMAMNCESICSILALAEKDHEHVVSALGPVLAIMRMALDAADRHAGPDSHESNQGRLHS